MKPLTDGWMRERPGARDFAGCYLRHFEALALELQGAMVDRPALCALLEESPNEQRLRVRLRMKGMFEQAFGGQWLAFAEQLHRDGVASERRGLSLHDWFALARGWSRLLVPRLVSDLGAEPERLSEALVEMNTFVDAVMEIMSNAYLSTSQEKLHRNELDLRRWETLVQSVPWGICVADASDRKIEFANEAFGRLYGLEASAIRGHTTDSLYGADELARARALYAQQARQAGGVSFETAHRRSDGSQFPVRVDAALIPGPDGREAWALSVRELTERRQLDEMNARGLELEAETQRAREASRLKSEFVANMSHELRTPLNAILGFSQLLREGEVGALSDSQQEFVDDIHTSGQHLLRLINDVLDLSKVEAGKMEFYPESIHLADLIQEVVGVLRPVLHDKQLTVRVSGAQEMPPVLLDPSRLKQVLYNYLSNAIKFSPRQGVIQVTVRAEEPLSFRLEVADHGIGISAADQRRLFTEFEQLESGRAKIHGGTGLGLALTRRLVEAQGGSVGVQSEPGAGSVFHAVLPCRSPVRGSLPPPRRLAGPTEDAPRVLVIEDDPADQDQIVSALLRAGYAVDVVATGAQALRSVDERRYDAITLDLLLPDTSGVRVLEALRDHRNARDVPVIVVSLVTEQVTGGFAVHDVLAKPLRADALRASLAQAGVPQAGLGAVLVLEEARAGGLAELIRAHLPMVRGGES